MSGLVVVEDEADVQFLIEVLFSADRRFTFTGVASSAEAAFEMTRTTNPGVIVLDQGLAGALTGLEAAPTFKSVAPQAKVILFTAHDELRVSAANEPAIDAFVLKTDAVRLLPMAQQLMGLDTPPG